MTEAAACLDLDLDFPEVIWDNLAAFGWNVGDFFIDNGGQKRNVNPIKNLGNLSYFESLVTR